MATEEKEIHMLKQYSHMYLPYTPWIISETWKFEKRKGGAECENVIFHGGKNQSLSPSEYLEVSN